VKDRFGGFRLGVDGAQAVHAAEIVCAVHGCIVL
jgi:hypothetical protein